MVSWCRDPIQKNGSACKLIKVMEDADQCLQHMSSNFVIQFESNTVAHGRSTVMATCGSHATDLSEVFSEGGYYYWSFRKVGGEWKITYLYLDVNWTKGDSLGLND